MPPWINRSEHTVHESPWIRLDLADVELPDGRHLDHYLLRQRPVSYSPPAWTAKPAC